MSENWLVTTSSNTARIGVYNGNNGSITFNVPFIENVSSSVLTSIGPEGQQFVESSGGTITVTNNGSMNEQSSTDGSLDYLLYILIIVAAVIVSLVIILKNRKKSSNASS
jgi:galactitol-specific phosphotransferase system IIC component